EGRRGRERGRRRGGGVEHRKRGKERHRRAEAHVAAEHAPAADKPDDHPPRLNTSCITAENVDADDSTPSRECRRALLVAWKRSYSRRSWANALTTRMPESMPASAPACFEAESQ